MPNPEHPELPRHLDLSRCVTIIQPQMHRNGSLYGYEALARFQVDKDTLLKPPDFLRGLPDVELAEHTLLTAAAASHVPDFSPNIAVNVAPKLLTDRDTVMRLSYAFRPTRGQRPVIELLEHPDMQSSDTSKVIASAQILQSRGFAIAIDDYPLGGSIELMKAAKAASMVPDIVKLTLVGRNDAARALLRREIAAIKRRNIGTVLVEGIQSQGDLIHAMSAGADVLQGYLYGGEPKQIVGLNPQE